MIIDLTNNEVQTIVDHIASTMPWARANPLLMKITQQAQAQQPPQNWQNQPPSYQPPRNNGGDVMMPPMPPTVPTE